MAFRRLFSWIVAAILLAGVGLEAHGVSRRDALFLLGVDGPAVGVFMYLGAKHMVTGYDHLLFLVGVVFFLYRVRDVLIYVSLFTAGHSLTLLAGVLGNIYANAYLVDAVIGVSVVYKAFENLGGFDRVLRVRLNPKIAVAGFGLIHGFGLATKLQDYALPQNGLVTNILSFNAGVEIGQGLALAAVLLVLSEWRRSPRFIAHSFAVNTVLMTCGFVLAGYQLAGYYLS